MFEVFDVRNFGVRSKTSIDHNRYLGLDLDL